MAKETSSEKLKNKRFIGRKIFIEENTSEVKTRKTMFFYDDVQDYDEFLVDEFIDHGPCTVVNMFNGQQKVILMDFRDFQKLHDVYIETSDKESILPHKMN